MIHDWLNLMIVIGWVVPDDCQSLVIVEDSDWHAWGAVYMCLFRYGFDFVMIPVSGGY